MTAVIYARVSAHNKGQTHDNQRLKLRAFAERLGYPLYREYCDQESGGTAERPQFQQLFVGAHRQRFDEVLLGSPDRFSREGVTETLNLLQRLSAAGVQFKSFTRQYLNSTGVFMKFIGAILAAIAKQERMRLNGRIKAVLARMRASNRKLGRPTAAGHAEAIQRLR